MNAETRAKELWVAMLEADPTMVADNPAVEALILQALRQAEEAAYERARILAQNEADFQSRNQRPGGGPSDGQIAAQAIALEIERLQSDRRSLKKD